MPVDSTIHAPEVLMRVTAVLSSLALASAAVVVATPASADPPPTCGSTLTVDTVLLADVVCAGPGLTLAPGVDLILKGHTLRGTAGGVGVSVASAGDSTVTDGTLRGWDTALATYAIPDVFPGPLHIAGVYFTQNGTGVDASALDSTGLPYTKDTTIVGSTFKGNRQVGLFSIYPAAFDVSYTTFADNRQGVSTAGVATVTNSQFARNGEAIVVAENNVTIGRSTFTDNPVAVASSPLAVFGNVTITNSRFTGSATAVDAAHAAARISGSKFVDNTTAVSVGMSGPTIVSNVFTRNQTTVKFVEPEWSAALVQGNTFLRNDDGLVVDVTSDAVLSVGGNDARDNMGWGIHVPGAVDLGGNTARGNGNEPQCVGVVCTP